MDRTAPRDVCEEEHFMVDAHGATRGVSPAVTLPPPADVAFSSLRLIAKLRVVTAIGQAVAIMVAVYAFGIHVPVVPVTAVLALETLIALLTWKRLRLPLAVGPAELFVQVHVDIAMLAAMFYFTGGTANPFAPLFLLPVAIAAASLEPRWICVTVISTVCAYTTLKYFHVPLYHPEGETVIHELHEYGMIVNYVFIAALLAFFVMRMRLDLQRHGRLLADVQEKQMRNDSMVAIGALAADCAHELSSPLGTIALVVTELQRERPSPERLQESLQTVDQQVQVAKQVLSNLTAAAGQRRAEGAGVARLDIFIRQIVNRAQALYPGATIRATMDDGGHAPQIVAEETLRQAFANLIDNAVRASPHDVEVKADWSGRELVVAVCDGGPGFPDDVLGMLGAAAPTIRGLDESVGLGLLLTNVTLGRLGGSLSLQNKPQGGACAEVRLPLRAILFEESAVAADRTAD